jgi:plasmid stabilization system protein ParE
VRPYRFLKGALRDVGEAVRYYDGESPDLGERFLDSLRAGLRRIRQHPEIGSRLRWKARKFVLHTFPYNIVYVNDPDEIVIVAVAGQARRSDYWRRRLPVM